MRTRIAAVVFATSIMLSATQGTVQAQSIWSQMIELLNQLQSEAEANTDYVFVYNNTSRIANFQVMRGDHTIVGSSGPVYPGALSPKLGDFRNPNPNRYNVRTFVLNERTGKWVQKTGWKRFVNPAHDLLLEYYQPAGGGFAIDWFVP